MSSSTFLPRRVALTLAAAASLALVLAGCTGDPSDLITSPSPSSMAPTPSASATPSPTAEPTATATPEATPVDIACDNLLSAQAIYDYNANFGAQPDYSPAGGTLPASAAAMNGTSCAWVNESSGEVIEVAVAKPSATTLAAMQNDAVTSSAAVPTYGTPPQLEGYFTTAGGVGEAQAFTNGYWIIIRSDYFIEPGDVSPLMDAVVSALP